MNQAGICGSGEVCERHHCFQKREDEEKWLIQARQPHSRALFTDHGKPEKGGGGAGGVNTAGALFCGKASPTSVASVNFDHNLYGTFNGAEVMS